MKKNKYPVLIILLFLVVRLVGLGRDVSNTDAYRWHRRSQNFLTALKTGNLKETYQHYQPGVTLMWLNAAVKQTGFTIQYHILGNMDPKTLENADWYPFIHGVSKAVLVFVLAGALIIQIGLLEKIFSKKIALIYGTLVAVEPYMIGLDRWFHLTSLETYFGFTSFLFLIHWYKKPQVKNLVSSGLFFTLSVLSKITTLLTIPIYLCVLCHRHYLDGEKNYITILKNLALLTISITIPLLLLFPALVVNTGYVIGQISLAGKNVVAVSNQGLELSPTVNILFYDLVAIVKLSPITLALFLAVFTKIRKTFNNKVSLVVLAYLLFYYIVLTVSQKKIDRYVLAMFPPMILLGSIYLSTLSQKSIRTSLIMGMFFLFFVSFLYHPVYSAYYSPLVGGTKTALKLGIYDNSGEYFSQAAGYLNSKGRDTKVFVPNGESSFDYYFKGKRVYGVNEEPDFVVVSLDSDRQVVKNHGCSRFEKSFGSRESNIIFIYGCK